MDQGALLPVCLINPGDPVNANEKKMNIKKEGINVLAGILLVIGLIFTIRYLSLNTWQIILFLIFTQIIIRLYYIIFKHKKYSAWDLIKSTGYIIILVHFIAWLNNYGIWGYITAVAVISGAILYKNRKRYLQVKHHIETIIWGKPIKNFIESGQKVPKFKVVR